jgi:hypothetical protein
MEENEVLNAFEASMDVAEVPQTPAANPTEAAQVEGADAPQAEEASDVTAEQEETETIEIDPDAPLFEQELEEDGKKVAQKLSLKELQQGYLRERDYRKKTQELARQREELPKAVAKQGQELSESYTKRLSELSAMVAKTVAADIAGKDLNQIAESGDMFEYMRVSNRMRQLQELQQAIQKEQEGESAKRKEEEQHAKADRGRKMIESLQRDIPDFGEPTVKRLIEVGKDFGFDQKEVLEWDDARIVKMAHALSEKKTVEAKRPEIEKKVAVVTKVLKPGQSAKSRSANDEAMAKLRKSGRREDAVGVFERFV